MVATAQAPAAASNGSTLPNAGLSAGVADGIRGELAALWPSDDAQPDPRPAPADAPSPTAAAAPGDASAADGEATRADAQSTPAPTPDAAPATADAPALPKTRAELDTLLADATKRQRNDQSRMKQELDTLKAELTQARLQAQAREGALAQLMEQYPGTEVESAVMREVMRGNTWAAEQLSGAQDAIAKAQTEAATLAQSKQVAALSLFNEVRAPLLHEAGTLGLSPADLDQIIQRVNASDPAVKRFGEKFLAARTVEDARDFAEAGYRLLDERVRAALQTKKIESLKEPDAPPKPQRTQHFGGNGATNSDPFGHIKDLDQRAKARLRDGMAGELAKLWAQE